MTSSGAYCHVDPSVIIRLIRVVDGYETYSVFYQAAGEQTLQSKSVRLSPMLAFEKWIPLVSSMPACAKQAQTDSRF